MSDRSHAHPSDTSDPSQHGIASDQPDTNSHRSMAQRPPYVVIVEPEAMTCSQQFRETDVIIPLVDCLASRVKSEEARTIEASADVFDTASEMDVERQRRELREEQDRTSDELPPGTALSFVVPEGEDPEYYFETLPMEDFNFLETYINIDFPRRSPSKDDRPP